MHPDKIVSIQKENVSLKLGICNQKYQFKQATVLGIDRRITEDQLKCIKKK